MYCPKCGNEIPNGSKVCVNCGNKLSKFKIIPLVVVLFAIVVILLLGGIFGSRYYRLSLLKSKIQEAVGRDNGYTETILKIESESPSRSSGREAAIRRHSGFSITLNFPFCILHWHFSNNLVNFRT